VGFLVAGGGTVKMEDHGSMIGNLPSGRKRGGKRIEAHRKKMCWETGFWVNLLGGIAAHAGTGDVTPSRGRRDGESERWEDSPIRRERECQ